jgi:N-acetylneuraminic acid mutarotase
LYAAGGANAPTETEAYQFSTNTWASLTAIPQSTIYPASAVYQSQLYCFGGWASWEGSIINNTQIYQP